MDLSGIFIVTIPTDFGENISGFNIAVILISVFNKSGLQKMYGLHIENMVTAFHKEKGKTG